MQKHPGTFLRLDEASAAIRKYSSKQKRFGFVFVDHSHAYVPVYSVCREVSTVISANGFCLFHDFNNPRNKEADSKDYRVYQAVIDGLPPNKFDFYGVYGYTGLYRPF